MISVMIDWLIDPYSLFCIADWWVPDVFEDNDGFVRLHPDSIQLREEWNLKAEIATQRQIGEEKLKQIGAVRRYDEELRKFEREMQS